MVRSARHVARVHAAQARERAKLVERSPKWPAARRRHLKAHPSCAACGARKGLQVHHVVPFARKPSRELDPTNLVTLCEYVGGWECHQAIGHGGSFKFYNPGVRRDAAEILKGAGDEGLLREVRARARAARKRI